MSAKNVTPKRGRSYGNALIQKVRKFIVSNKFIIAMILFVLLPNMLAVTFEISNFINQLQFNVLVIPVACIALFWNFIARKQKRRIDDLQKQLEWHSAAIQTVRETILITDRNGVIEFVNPAFTTCTGYTKDYAVGKTPAMLKSGQMDDVVYQELWDAILNGHTWQGEMINRRKNGELITESMRISPFQDGFISTSSDITEFKHQHEESRRVIEEREALFNNAGVGIALLDLWGRFIEVNDFCLGMLGYTRENASALSNKDITHDDDLVETQQIFVALASGEIPRYEIDRRFVRNGGRVFWGHLSMTPVRNESGYIRAIIAIVQDINERKKLEEKLESMAHYDALTGLPNRALFFDRLAQSIFQSRRNQGVFALMFVDLDGFKAVNDTFGHDTGDALLRAVAGQLLECVRESDTVARMGGDEFTIILRAIRGPQDAAAVAEKILAALAAPYHLLDHECRIGASLGIVLYPKHGDNAEVLLSQADVAMYAVKKAGKNAYRFAGQ